MQMLPFLYVAKSELGGRGVFTREVITVGTLIEVAPVIVLPGKDTAKIHATRLHDYYFIWGENDDQCAIVLGYGSLYNHDFQPNTEYQPNFEEQTLEFYAIRNIPAGEEIKVNYNGDPRIQEKLWFEDKN
ncbi:MAG: SET domain-containing protein-lysine N-methyltransferase [Phaeodactylibacter sp.]|nr:SET domain-containing protein-lysine N-methyltransferase [Phaeodactylibacter sp.]